MGLIKSANTPASLLPFSLTDIERHAKSILLRARQQAEQLLVEAQGEAESLKRQSQAEGLAEGKRAGLAQGSEQGRTAAHQQALAEHKAQFEKAIAALNQAAATLNASRADLESVALAEVVKLSIAVSRRVTKRQGLIEPQVLEANLGEALKLVVASADVRVAIHPAQRATLDAALPLLRLKWPNLAHVHVIEDAALTPGGCRVFTDHGQIDADLAGQLDRIAAELLPTPAAPAEGAA